MLRKLSSLFCAAALSFALVGCADSQVDSTTTPAVDDTDVTAPADVEPAADDTVADDTAEPAAEDEGTN